ncbi:hypothetical protein KY284_036796 [Solanum tuberosum]|nr:hypothetical protein KY284_036796 [Solanum tuberosum]
MVSTLNMKKIKNLLGFRSALNWRQSVSISFKILGNGHIELVKLFLPIGVDVDLRSDVGTPFICVVDHSQEDVIKVLVEYHANFDAQIGDDNMCPLLAVATVDYFCCLKAGDIVNVKVSEGMWCGEITPSFVAARKATSDNRESTEVLLSVTPQIQSVRERTMDGVIAFMKS